MLPLLGSFILVKLFMMRAALRGLGLADMYRWLWRRRALIGRLDRADFVIFPSKAVAMTIASRLSHDRWRIMRNGLSKEWFDNPRPPAGKVNEPADLVVGFAGAMSPHKGPHVLLEALKQLGWRQTRVRLAGPICDQAYAARLRSLAEGLNVEFTGSLPSDRMPAFLRSLDVLAMTSLWPENCPYTVLEAQAANVQVVGSRAGGVTELIADERLLFEPGSAEGLASALDHARRHPDAGRQTHVPTADEMTEAVERIYRQVTHGRTAPL
jgi:glycosyltransferase involved in cell wall biosynthesis